MSTETIHIHAYTFALAHKQTHSENTLIFLMQATQVPSGCRPEAALGSPSGSGQPFWLWAHHHLHKLLKVIKATGPPRSKVICLIVFGLTERLGAMQTFVLPLEYIKLPVR